MKVGYYPLTKTGAKEFCSPKQIHLWCGREAF